MVVYETDNVFQYVRQLGLFDKRYMFRTESKNLVDTLYEDVSKVLDPESNDAVYFSKAYETYVSSNSAKDYLEFIKIYLETISKLDNKSAFTTSKLVDTYDAALGLNFVQKDGKMIAADEYNNPIRICSDYRISYTSDNYLCLENEIPLTYDVIQQVFYINTTGKFFTKTVGSFSSYKDAIMKNYKDITDFTDYYEKNNTKIPPLQKIDDDTCIPIAFIYLTSSEKKKLFSASSKDTSTFFIYIDVLGAGTNYTIGKLVNSGKIDFYKVDMFGGISKIKSDDDELNAVDGNLGDVKGGVDASDDVGFINDNDMGFEFIDTTDENGNEDPTKKKLSDHKKTNVLSSIAELFQVIFAFCLDPLNAIFELIFDLILSLLDHVIAAIKYGLQLAGQAICTWGKFIFEKLIDGLKSVFNVFMSNVLVPVEDFLASTFGGVINTVVNFITNIFQDIKNAVSEITTMIYSLFSGIESVFQTMYDSATNVVNKAESVLTGNVETLKSTTNNVLSTADSNLDTLNTNVIAPENDTLVPTDISTDKATVIDSKLVSTSNNDISSVETNIGKLDALSNKVDNEANSVPQASSLKSIASGFVSTIDGGVGKVEEFLPYFLVIFMFVAILIFTRTINRYILDRIN